MRTENACEKCGRSRSQWNKLRNFPISLVHDDRNELWMLCSAVPHTHTHVQMVSFHSWAEDVRRICGHGWTHMHVARYMLVPITAKSVRINIKHANLYMETRLSQLCCQFTTKQVSQTHHRISPTATENWKPSTIKIIIIIILSISFETDNRAYITLNDYSTHMQHGYKALCVHWKCQEIAIAIDLKWPEGKCNAILPATNKC